MGGGNFITQAAPTNFHCFWPRKVLSAGESVDDFMEVTPAQKAAIEVADAKWVAPGEELIAQAEAAGVVYNKDSGYFELNGLVDITAEQMRLVLRESSGANYLCDYCHAYGKARTYLPIQNSRGNYGGTATRAFSGCANLEVVDFAGSGYVALTADTFAGCVKLRRIINGKLHVGNSAIFANLRALEELCVDRLTIDIIFAGSPLLSLESIQYMVDNAANTTAITITLHADAYARLTDELIAQAAQRQITFAST